MMNSIGIIYLMRDRFVIIVPLAPLPSVKASHNTLYYNGDIGWVRVSQSPANSINYATICCYGNIMLICDAFPCLNEAQ